MQVFFLIRLVTFLHMNGKYNDSTFTTTWNCDFFRACQAYLWHNNEAAVEWVESQMSSSAQSTLTQNLECIRKDRVLRQVQA